ncbi:calcium/sodium antiporter [Paroceanicella profunda]|uniref:Calcium/sodium antiporter n=1 Tax=Paroceanicella profunda TaxID=2579971 RepID=A0A5B8FU18_9RHOB|nr:calcium/sodium antiporter [Paroceanicella profunda]QDL92296.1 calcium/sodium antiporter [Paroceanicella profunda]
MDIVWVLAGLVLLVVGGDVLVKGAVGLSLKLGIPALIVSLTIVAFGTSAPELLISVKSAMDGLPGLAIGNVVGSNIANVLLVLGIPALIAPIATRDCETGRSFVIMLGVLVLFTVLCFLGPLTWWHGLVLLGVLAAVIAENLWSAKKSRDSDMASELDEVDPHLPGWKLSLLIVAGIITLPLGAQMLIEGARNIASQAGISDAAIGLTLVAVGTSLPELATSVMAAIRRQADVAMGNVIGSNIFNIGAIMGITSFFGPVEVDQSFLDYDLWVMIAVSLVLAPFICKIPVLGRFSGGVFVALYVGYIWTVL